MSSGSNSNEKNNRVPVLIIPGFMSSGLVCQRSGYNRNFEGKRVWLNIAQIGFQSLHSDGAVVQNEQKKRDHDRGVKGAQYNEALHAEYQEAHRCKSAWRKFHPTYTNCVMRPIANAIESETNCLSTHTLITVHSTQSSTCPSGATCAANAVATSCV